jgi:hypothetical protein
MSGKQFAITVTGMIIAGVVSQLIVKKIQDGNS